MFLVKIYSKSIFSLKGIYSLKSEHILKIICYFILMSLIATFPHNYAIVKEGGFKLGFISEAYTDPIRNDFLNTKIKNIGKIGLICNEPFEIEKYEFNDFILIIDFNDEYIRSSTIDKNTLVLKKNSTLYYNTKNAVMSGSYNSFDKEFSINAMKFDDSLFKDFFAYLEKTFSSKIILFSVIINTITNFGTYILMCLVIAFLLTYLKYRFSLFTTFKQTFTIVVLSMTLPSTICFILGLFNIFQFTSLIMNFLIGGIALLVYLKVAKKELQ